MVRGFCSHRTLGLMLAAALVIALGSPAAWANSKVVIWWNKGYYEEEDDALIKAVDDFRALTGYEVEVSFYTTEDLPVKLVSAVEAGTPPDVVFSHYSDWMFLARYARTGQLVDVSDIIEKHKDRFIPEMLETAYQYNAREDKWAYYGVPLEAQMMQAHYWRDLVEIAGFDPRPEAIPRQWDDFWNFWKQVQDSLRSKDRRQYRRTFGMGIPVSTGATDTFFLFEAMLPNFGGDLVAKDGTLQVNHPKNRQAIVDTLRFMSDIYLEGYTPPGSINWIDADNNAYFHNKTVVMTPNPSLSIPGAQMFTNPDNYYNKMQTIPWPLSPSGEKRPNLVAVKTILIFEDATNIQGGKEFVDFLIQPENLAPYIVAANGRWFPAFKDVAQDPFFHNPEDPHVPQVTKMFLEEPIQPFYYVYNPAYSDVYTENLWGRALGRIIVDGVSPEEAADQVIARINEIFANWQ